MPADISFASFNLYNFQKIGQPVHRRPPVTPSEYNGKRAWTRTMLTKLNADVVAFQELWNKDCLDDVLDQPEFIDYQPEYISDQWRGIAVAMIVKKPWIIESKEVVKNFRFSELIKLDEGDDEDDEFTLNINRFSRSVLKVIIRNTSSPSTPPITVFACHLKSKMPTFMRDIASKYQGTFGSAVSTIRRTAEATALKQLLIDHMEGSNTPTVVLGDLNDDSLSNTLNILTGQPSMSKRAQGSDKALYSTLHLQQLQSFRDVHYTHEHKNHFGVLDHILVSEEFFDYSTDGIWSHKKTRIWNDHIEDDNQFSSDHGLIKSEFS